MGQDKDSMDQNGVGEMSKKGMPQSFMGPLRGLNFILFRSGKYRRVLSVD